MRAAQKGRKDRRRGSPAPMPAKLSRVKGDRHRQSKPTWHAPRKGRS